MKISANQITKAATVIIIVMIVPVLSGMLFNISFFKTLMPGFVNVKFNTVLCLLFSAIALLFLNQKEISRNGKVIAFILSFIVLLISLLTLSEYIFGWNTGIDNLFFTPNNTTPETLNSGRMPFATSVFLLLYSLVLLLLYNRRYHFFLHIILITGIVFLVLIFLISLTIIKAGKTSSVINTTLLQSRFIFLALYFAAFFSYPLSYLKFSFQKKIAGFFVMVSLVLAVIFFAFKKNNEHVVDTAQWVDHTHEVLFLTQKINTETNEMQSGARGYIISGQENYLPLFLNTANNIFDVIHTLRAMTKDNTNQQLQIDTLEKLLNAYIISRKELINIRREKGFEVAQRKFMIGDGKIILDKVRSILSSIEQEETKLLAKRKVENEQSIRNSSRVITLFQVITGLLLLAALIIIYNNTRKRNRAEAEIKRNNIFLETILENIPSMIFVKEPREHRFIQLNNQTEKIFGLSRKELLGKTDYDLFPAEKADRYLKTEKEVFLSGKPLEIPAELISTANGDRWLRRNKIPVYDKNNKPLYLIGISEDITEKKIAEEQLHEFKHFFNNSNDFSCIANTEGYFEILNPKFEEELGYSQNELSKNPFLEFVHPDDIPATLLEYEKLKAGAITINFENRYRKKDGSYLLFDWNATPNPLTGKIYCIARDITERKILEDKLKQFNRELEQKVKERTEELSKKAKELQNSNTELERFAYVASHDLQEPLRMVSSFLNLLEEELEGQLNKTAKEYIDFVLDGAGRMKILINDLLMYSRVGSNKEEFTPTDLNKIMEYVTLVLASEIKKTHAMLNVKALPVINANSTLISQLFMNLVSNALKYHNNRELIIEIGSTEEAGYYIFHVKDNGIGIDPDFFDKIFIIFQRLHSKSEYSGTGIGLAICKKIVETHHGKIWVESEKGKGSTFYFSIPKNNI